MFASLAMIRRRTGSRFRIIWFLCFRILIFSVKLWGDNNHFFVNQFWIDTKNEQWWEKRTKSFKDFPWKLFSEPEHRVPGDEAYPRTQGIVYSILLKLKILFSHQQQILLLAPISTFSLLFSIFNKRTNKAKKGNFYLWKSFCSTAEEKWNVSDDKIFLIRFLVPSIWTISQVYLVLMVILIGENFGNATQFLELEFLLHSISWEQVMQEKLTRNSFYW